MLRFLISGVPVPLPWIWGPFDLAMASLTHFSKVVVSVGAICVIQYDYCSRLTRGLIFIYIIDDVRAAVLRNPASLPPCLLSRVQFFAPPYFRHFAVFRLWLIVLVHSLSYNTTVYFVIFSEPRSVHGSTPRLLPPFSRLRCRKSAVVCAFFRSFTTIFCILNRVVSRRARLLFSTRFRFAREDIVLQRGWEVVTVVAQIARRQSVPW